MYRVLIIEDEPAIVESLAFSLKRAGVLAQGSHSLAEARACLSGENASTFDLLILDLMLPDGSGFEILSYLRSESLNPAVIVLSSRDHEADRVKALEEGADDYVTKPFSLREVVARVHAVLRRRNRPIAPEEAASVLRLDIKSRRVFVDQQSIELTKVEFELLSLFASDASKAYLRAEMIDTIWGDGFALSDRTVDSHIKSLRRKLTQAGGAPEWIETVRGIGYRLGHKVRLVRG